jgi:ribose 1,5-bisphosphokinase PhnN
MEDLKAALQAYRSATESLQVLSVAFREEVLQQRLEGVGEAERQEVLARFQQDTKTLRALLERAQALHERLQLASDFDRTYVSDNL